MAIFGNESLRLLREKWPDANMLAEELYAIFRALDSQPSTQNTPAAITSNQQGVAPLTLTPYPNDTLLLQFGPQGIDGSMQLINGFPTPVNGQGQQQGGGGDAGTIVGGSGNTYQVQLKSSGKTVTATQLQIASTETIPVGTSCLVAKVTVSGAQHVGVNQSSNVQGAQYFIQVPVWL
jgi:hypothetical protein